MCGSGLAAVMHAADAIAAGTAAIVVAGGTESMSNAPYLLKGARWGYRMGNAEVVDVMVGEGLTCAIEGCHMGTTAEAVAAKYGITRAAQDAFAAESQRRAGAALEAGWFADEIVPVTLPQKKGDPVVVSRDEYPRPGTTAEKLGALKPAFQKDGTVTAGNASGINDGAAALVVADERVGCRTRPRAAGAHPGVRDRRRGADADGTGTGAGRAQGRDARGPRRWPTIDLFELNEAFAAQALAVMQDLGVDPVACQRRRRSRGARPSHRRQRRARAGDADPSPAPHRRALRRRVALRRRRHGGGDGGGTNGVVQCSANASTYLHFALRTCTSGTSAPRLRRFP